MMVEFLSYVHACLGRSRISRRLLRALRLHRLGRAWLRRSFLSQELVRPDDITVLIGVRNRGDHRLANALRSLRAQTYPTDSIRITVLDYGSEPKGAARTEATCREHNAEYLRIEDASVWSRSRCLNVGIRRATTKFLMTSDVDIVLSPTYLADAVHELTVSPLSVVCSPMLDLPEESVEVFLQAAEAGDPLPIQMWKERSSPRLGWDFHPSIAVSYTAFFQLVRGYDEYFEVWGAEDDDLMRRFGYLGLRPRTLSTDSFYLHQWHPKYEDIPDGEHAVAIQRNRAHLKRNHSILRNGPNWGLP